MDQIAQQQLQQRESAIAEIRTVADAERRKQWVRAKLLEIIGGLPDYQGPLNARITGRLGNDYYTIEKVIFESLPGYFVTALLYRPHGPGRFPGVLVSSGHTESGKIESHRIAANLAAKGFVALTYDPVGQGERVQLFDRRLGRSLANGRNNFTTNEHNQAGAQSRLIGESVARYFIWDAKRALDYLLSRSEVDAARVGCAGCSGGGALTTYIASLDSRLKAAAPACFINSFRLLFTGPVSDSEMTLPNFISSGLDMADFVELSAPTPWLILATEGDFFTPQGAKLVYEEGRRWYRIYGAEDKLRFFVGPGPHGTPLETREAIYEWMIRWLQDGQGDFHEQGVKLYPNHELLVTKTGQVEEEPGSRKLYHLILDEFHARQRPGTIPELLAELRRLKVPSEGPPPAFKVLNESNDEDTLRQRISLATEPGLDIGGTLYIPRSGGRKPAVLLVADNGLRRTGQEPTPWLAERFAKAGRVVLELEVREPPVADENRPFNSDSLSNIRAGLIGRNLPAMRAHDILRGVDLLAARSDVDPASIRAVARKVKGIWLLLAAASDARIGKIWLDRTPHSLRAALENPVNTNLYDAVIPGFVLHWDLQDLTKAMGNRPVLWSDPADWMEQTIPLGSGFQYRYERIVQVEPDDALIEEFLR